MNNAQKLYFTTRPTASPESIRRAKELPPAQLHVMFLNKVNNDALERTKFVENLKSFRPQLTVLEMHDAAGKPAQIMKTKRKRDTKFIEQTKVAKILREEETFEEPEVEMNEEDEELMKLLKKEKEIKSNPEINKKTKSQKKKKPQSFRDEEFFMSNQPSKVLHSEKGYEGGDNEMNDRSLSKSVALDLIGDDAEQIMKQKSVFKWDKRKQKYIHTTLGASMEKKSKVKNEAGKTVEVDSKKKGTSYYKEWQKKTKKSIKTIGEEEKSQKVGKDSRILASVSRQEKYKKKEESSKVKDEVKGIDDYRKFKKVKELNRLKNRRGGFKGEGKSKGGASNQFRGKSSTGGGRSKFIKKKERGNFKKGKK